MFRNLKKTTVAIILVLAFTMPAYADPAPLSQDEQTPSGNSAAQQNQDQQQSKDNQLARQQRINNTLKSDPIVKDIQTIVNFLSAGVGIVVTGAIIVGGIQYSIAGDNQSQLTAAKKRIANAIIALAVFMFIFAFVQWLIPGGLFS